jgi:hypothetical protein
VKDQQIQKLYEDIESWREQVRYKELQLARLQDRVIELPSPEEAEPTEQKPELSQPSRTKKLLILLIGRSHFSGVRVCRWMFPLG